MMTMYISPYRRLATLREAMDRLLEESMTESQAERELTLSANVLARDEDFVIQALVPGLQAEDVNIEILNNTVSIRGEFKGVEGENVKLLAYELPTGRFARVITLPVAVDSTKAEATIKDGVLTLRLPKAESHRPKSIKVNVA